MKHNTKAQLVISHTQHDLFVLSYSSIFSEARNNKSENRIAIQWNTK